MPAGRDRLKPQSSEPPPGRERRRQVRGLLVLALAALLFGLLRAGLSRIFTQGWWRLW